MYSGVVSFINYTLFIIFVEVFHVKNAGKPLI